MIDGFFTVQAIVLVAGIVVALQVFLIALDRLTRGRVGTQKAHELHLLRRVQHCFTGLLLLAIYPYLGHERSKVFVVVPTLLHAGVDYYRRKVNPKFNAWFLGMTGNILRPEERVDRFSASVWFLAGVTFVPFISSHPTVVYLSVLNLSFCDPAASIAGITIPSPKFSPRKSLSGTIAAVFVGMGTAGIYSWTFREEVNLVLAAGISGIAEFVTIPGLDDNFTIPVLSAILWKAALFYLI